MACYRDDRLKERTLVVNDLLASIRVLGPKRGEDEILMELPSRTHLRQMLTERVKANWSKSKELIETKYAIKREYAQFSKNNLQSIKSEMIEHVSENDPRFEKLFYMPKGSKSGFNSNRLPEDKIDEPKHLQSKKQYEIDYITCVNSL